MDLNEYTSLLKASFEENSLPYQLPDDASEHLFSFLNLLITENQKYNLTAIKAPEEIICKHFTDSLIISSQIPQNSSLIDIGCGAGFPSLPLAITRPDLDITALDSTGKKINFVNIVKDMLDIKNITAISARAEEISHDPAFRDKFDVATARAVANFPVLCELCLPFVRKNGRFLAMKGRFSPQEFSLSDASLASLSAKNINISTYSLVCKGVPEERTLVSVDKIGKTLTDFPRKFSQISKNPLR